MLLYKFLVPKDIAQGCHSLVSKKHCMSQHWLLSLCWAWMAYLKPGDVTLKCFKIAPWQTAYLLIKNIIIWHEGKVCIILKCVWCLMRKQLKYKGAIKYLHINSSLSSALLMQQTCSSLLKISSLLSCGTAIMSASSALDIISSKGSGLMSSIAKGSQRLWSSRHWRRSDFLPDLIFPVSKRI